MRSFLSRLIGKDGPPAKETRPEQLRRRVLGTNARVLVALSLIGLPVGLHGLLTGSLLTFVVAIQALASGTLSLVLHQDGQFDRSAGAQVYGMLGIGLMLALGEPQLTDFGLALALLAPVHAALLGSQSVQKGSWIGVVAVVAAGCLASLNMPWPASLSTAGAGLQGVVFLIAALIVGWSANRLNAVFEVYERAQINAFRHLVEHVQDSVLRFASDGALLFASRQVETLLGCRRYELSGTGLVERIHLLDRPAYMTAFAEANVDGKTRRVEMRVRHDDADAGNAPPRYIWIEASLSPVPGNGPGQHEVVALLRDITSRRDSDAEMREARRQAEAASDAKSRFLATIGHELRTPLNAIVGFSEMMTTGIGGDLPPQQREYARLIHDSGRHLIDVVQMLLDMSRLEAGKFDLQTDSIDPESLVRPSLSMVEGMARDRKVRIVVDSTGALPRIVADERALRQVLINLLSNAVKFSHEGGAVTLGLKRQGRFLNLTVADRGIGMTDAALRRVGEPFFQANDGLNRRYEGTGLGLSIVKGLVGLHDGQLHVSSVPGEGTTVTVLLPINGPETKVDETATVTPLHRDPAPQQKPQWQEDGKRRAL